MANKRLIKTLETELEVKRNKTVEDEEMIKLLRRYLDNVEANLPKTKINKDDLDDDEPKKDDQNPSGLNSSQSTKPSGSRGGEKKEDAKKDEDTRRKGEKKSRKPHDDSGTQTTLNIQT
ncbi:hypothetical protein AgCh_006270 [Apium graveolens]